MEVILRIMFGNRKQTERQLEKLESRVERLLDEFVKLSQTVTDRTREWDHRLERFEALTEEIDARIDRGNKLWRRIRAREVREAERAEDEGEAEEDPQLHFEHGEGSNGEGVYSMYGDMARPGNALQPHQQVARALALQRARRFG